MTEDTNKIDETAAAMDDVEIAELAAKELSKKDDEIMQLKRELAKAKLYSVPKEEPTEVLMTKEEALEKMQDPHISNLDYCKAVCRVVDIEREAGNPNPLTPDGDKVYDYFKKCIDESGGDSKKFLHIYQAGLQDDPLEIKRAWEDSHRN